jgi:methylenetetrahydrofolate dehydrogenase (NADP+)/methenyltetrahydrofolate cyclohydrolase
MTARMIDGKALAASTRAALVPRVQALTAAGHQPGLAVILVGDDPASEIYVRNKVKACEDIGIRSLFTRLPAETTEAELLGHIARLNADAGVHGILLQLPLPKHLDTHRILETIAFDKDVDG